MKSSDSGVALRFPPQSKIASGFTTLILSSLIAVSLFASVTRADSIPDRPEKLQFPPLKYEPPTPDDYRVQLKSGPVAYIMPDRERPLVNLTIYIRTGTYLEPAGKEGLAELTGWLLAHGGAGTNSAEQLEERLAFLAANLGTDISDTEGTVSLNLLAKDTDEGFAILHDVLFAPRFQDDKITLRKTQMLQSMKQRNDDSSDIEGREAGFLSRGEKFFENRYVTSNSIASITHRDLEEFHYAWFWPSNFVVGVSGDFDRKEMITKLEKLFSGGPREIIIKHLLQIGTPPAIPTNFTFAAAGVYLVNKPEVDQGRVTMMLPGILRDSPDYYAGLVMNSILDGGGFSSRLMGRVRSDEGLAYDVHSFQTDYADCGTLQVFMGVDADDVGPATRAVLAELARLRDERVPAAELERARNFALGRLELRLEESRAMASFLGTQESLHDQVLTLDEVMEKLRAVTADDVQSLAGRLFRDEHLCVAVIGPDRGSPDLDTLLRLP